MTRPARRRAFTRDDILDIYRVLTFTIWGFVLGVAVLLLKGDGTFSPVGLGFVGLVIDVVRLKASDIRAARANKEQ